MSLVNYRPNSSIVPLAAQALEVVQLLDTAKELGNFAARLYKNLPDIKLRSGNNNKSSLQRKMVPSSRNGSKSGKGVASAATARQQLQDKGVSSGGSAQRSMTSSYAVGVSNQGARRRSKIARSPYLDSISVCFRASADINNAGAGFQALAISLAVSTPGTDLSSYMTQLTALGGIFREFRFKRVDAAFVPRLGSTAAGVIGIGVDRDPRTAAVATVGEIIRRDPFIEVDIKQPGQLTWKPVVAQDNVWRYTTDAGRPLENLSQGVILITTTNDQAAAAAVGTMFFDAWIEFAIPY